MSLVRIPATPGKCCCCVRCCPDRAVWPAALYLTLVSDCCPGRAITIPLALLQNGGPKVVDGRCLTIWGNADPIYGGGVVNVLCLDGVWTWEAIGNYNPLCVFGAGIPTGARTIDSPPADCNALSMGFTIAGTSTCACLCDPPVDGCDGSSFCTITATITE